MKLIKILGVVGALGVLAACTSDLQRLRTTEPSGGTPFTQALTKEYRDLAVFEADEMMDWRDAGYYARRGLQSAAGEVVRCRARRLSTMRILCSGETRANTSV